MINQTSMFQLSFYNIKYLDQDSVGTGLEYVELKSENIRIDAASHNVYI